MRVVYFGTADFAVPSLQRIAPHVVTVVSQPSRPTGRGMKLTPPPVAAVALDLGLPLLQPESAKDPAFIAQIQALEADLIVVAAYGQILREGLLNAATQGSVNLHGSILPKYRGAAPIQRCIQNGDRETGVTLMQMAKGMDTGDIIAIERTAIGADETYGELSGHLAQVAADLLEAWLPRLCAGDYPRFPQDHEAATYAAKIERSECELSCSRSSIEEYRRFLAVTPHPGAWIATKHGDLKLVEMNRTDRSVPAGQFLVDGGLFLGFAQGALEVERLKVPGRQATTGLDFAHGFRIQTGDSAQ